MLYSPPEKLFVVRRLPEMAPPYYGYDRLTRIYPRWGYCVQYIKANKRDDFAVYQASDIDWEAVEWRELLGESPGLR